MNDPGALIVLAWHVEYLHIKPIHIWVCVLHSLCIALHSAAFRFVSVYARNLFRTSKLPTSHFITFILKRGVERHKPPTQSPTTLSHSQQVILIGGSRWIRLQPHITHIGFHPWKSTVN